MRSIYDEPLLYDRVVVRGPCERFYCDLARAAARTRCGAGGGVLELACGSGRLTLPLARCDLPVTGLDQSRSMLRVLKAKAEIEGLKVDLHRADMRRFELGRRYALVIVSCNSLAHLVHVTDIRSCLRRVQEHLLPDGVLAFDVVNPRPDWLWPPAPGPIPLHRDSSEVPQIAIEETASYDPVQQVRTAHWRVCRSKQPHAELAPLRLRVIYPQELVALLASEGFELAARYGDFSGLPLTSASLNQVCVAKRAV